MESEENQGKKRNVPLKIKIQAITDLAAEIETVESICVKYNIHRCTVTRWKNKVNALQGDSYQKSARDRSRQTKGGTRNTGRIDLS